MVDSHGAVLVNGGLDVFQRLLKSEKEGRHKRSAKFERQSIGAKGQGLTILLLLDRLISSFMLFR